MSNMRQLHVDDIENHLNSKFSSLSDWFIIEYSLGDNKKSQ